MHRFDADVHPQIGSYVYALVDPRVDSNDPTRIFYIGKGTKDRCFQHAHQELTLSDVFADQLKLSKIREIRGATGAPPDILMVSFKLTDEQAHQIEAVLIGLLSSLTNAVGGHDSGSVWLSAPEVNALFHRPIPVSDLGANVLLVSLNGGKNNTRYPEFADIPPVLAQRTLGNWAINANDAAEVDYVLGVYQSLIRCVFKIEKNDDRTSSFEILPAEKPRGRRRIQFSGRRDSDKEQDWALRSIANNDGKLLTKFEPQQATRLVKACSLGTLTG